MEAEDLARVAESLRRGVADQNADGVRGAVREFGWYELLDEEAEAAVSVLFSLQGEQLLPLSFLDDVLIAASGLDLGRGASVVLPHLGSLEPTSTIEGSRMLLDGVVQTGSRDVLLVPCLQEGEVVLAACAARTAIEVMGTLDPDSGWGALEQSAPVDDILLRGADAAEAWLRMSAAGRRALAHELVAVGGQMMRLALEHVTTREQFGQTLGSFQVVKHKLADVRLWQEVAILSSEGAWEDGGPESAALAKAAACRFTRAAREHCQQLLGGMGFTWEHSFHTYLRRALVLEPLLGGLTVQHRWLGEALRRGTTSRELAGL